MKKFNLLISYYHQGFTRKEIIERMKTLHDISISYLQYEYYTQLKYPSITGKKLPIASPRPLEYCRELLKKGVSFKKTLHLVNKTYNLNRKLNYVHSVSFRLKNKVSKKGNEISVRDHKS